MKITKLLMIASACCAPAFLTAQNIVTDTFADNERDTQNLPTSMHWWTGYPSVNIDASSGSLIGTGLGGAGTTILGYFTNAGTVSLGIGQGLQVTINFSTDNPTARNNNFRIGLFDSTTSTSTDPAPRVSADSFANNYLGFAGYTGYAMRTDVGDEVSLSINERTDMVSSTLISGTAEWTSLGTAASAALTANTPYVATLTAMRTGTDQMDISFVMTGGSLSGYTLDVSDVAGITSSFDTLAIFANSYTADNLTISSVMVDVVAVPEPATFALLFGLVGIAVVVLRRRTANP